MVLIAFLMFSMTSGSFLVINKPQPADAIVVLAGETDRRPARALELLSQHYAPKIILDVPSNARIYNRSIPELAAEYVEHLPQKDAVSLCSIFGLSTKAEAHDVESCLQRSNVHTILLVTSDFHTRRALSIFTHELPSYRFSVAAAYDPQQFGTKWWQHRQWAKQNFDEWFRLAWWEGVDRWR